MRSRAWPTLTRPRARSSCWAALPRRSTQEGDRSRKWSRWISSPASPSGRIGFRPRARVQSDPEFVSRAARLLERAERPAIIAGSSIWWDDAPEALAQLADRTGAPVYLNGAGRGSLPPEHPNFFTHTRKDALS